MSADPTGTAAPDLLRLLTAGSVDDGKSTLVGRLLLDSRVLLDDQVANVRRLTEQRNEDHLNLALITDGLRAEREQGITIDVAYRYFATARRRFILADTPGHIQYTRNMVTGASTASLAVLLVDARNGMTEQTRRHALVVSLLNIRHLILCVNKMDLVGWSEAAFDALVREFTGFASKLDIPDIRFIPIAALHGDNVVERSAHMPWYAGLPLLATLETAYIASDHNHVDARFPVQTVIRPNHDDFHDFRGLAGRVASGVFKPGDEIMVLPSHLTTRIKSIHGPAGEVAEAFAPMSVVMTTTDDLDVSRGDLVIKAHNQPRSTRDFEAMVCWFSAEPLQPAGRYLLRHTTRDVRCAIREVRYKVDISTLHRASDDFTVGMNDIARLHLHTAQPVFYDSYRRNRTMGSFILINESSNETVAAGMILDQQIP